MSAQTFAICACKQLRSLTLTTGLANDELLKNETSMLQIFVASLPELRVLLIQEACPYSPENS